jgi:predicted  nucleic acid-binding Zn-ribbon protein
MIMGEDKIPPEVLDKLPDYFQKKFEKIKYSVHEAGVKPSNIKQIIAELEMNRQKLKRRMVNDRELMEWMKNKPRNSARNQNMIDFAAKDLKEMERSLIDLNEGVQTMKAVEAGLKHRKIGITIEDVKRLKAMHEKAEDGLKVSRKALEWKRPRMRALGWKRPRMGVLKRKRPGMIRKR